MPNHVTNKITFSGDIDLLNKILDEVKDHNGAIDFNSLIPRPLSVRTMKTLDSTPGLNGTAQIGALRRELHLELKGLDYEADEEPA
ncbi:MAG: hypothetical protein AB2669_19960 [Candidatus Thiodiazotropha endolucinida]